MNTKTIIFSEDQQTALGKFKDRFSGLKAFLKYNIFYKRYISYLGQQIFRGDEASMARSIKNLGEVEDPYLQKKILAELGSAIRNRTDIFFKVVTDILAHAADDIKYDFLRMELDNTRYYVSESNIYEQYNLLLEKIGELNSAELRDHLYAIAAKELSKELDHYRDLFCRMHRQKFIYDGTFLNALNKIFYTGNFSYNYQLFLQQNAAAMIKAIIATLDAIKTNPKIATIANQLMLLDINGETAEKMSFLLSRFLEISEENINYYEELQTLLAQLRNFYSGAEVSSS